MFFLGGALRLFVPVHLTTSKSSTNVAFCGMHAQDPHLIQTDGHFVKNRHVRKHRLYVLTILP